jgi:L-ascorbate metabolism protein UlaG (beta-lactamase superfamily)
MNAAVKRLAVCLIALGLVTSPRAAAPSYVDITWMSVTSVYYEIGPLRILTDGFITSLPQSAFFGGGGGLAMTRQAFKPDVDAVRRVLTALGGPSSVDLLLTGHSHWDHSFDTATWSRLTGARIVGAKTTCFQAMAEGLPADRCTAVYGGERSQLADGVTMRVVRWNHSGSSTTNPEQHDPIELRALPRLDPQTGGLRAGVAEDFPNGGGSRAFLFVVDGPGGRFSWFYNSTASAADLDVPIVVDGINYGAPIDNLQAALRAEKLESVDLWIANSNSGVPVARLLMPLLKPKAYVPVHWDGVHWAGPSAFEAGVQRPFSAPALEAFLEKAGVQVVRPGQYMDKWRLDRTGIRAVPNTAVKKALGFESGPAALR